MKRKGKNMGRRREKGEGRRWKRQSGRRKVKGEEEGER